MTLLAGALGILRESRWLLHGTRLPSLLDILDFGPKNACQASAAKSVMHPTFGGVNLQYHGRLANSVRNPQSRDDFAN